MVGATRGAVNRTVPSLLVAASAQMVEALGSYLSQATELRISVVRGRTQSPHMCAPRIQGTVLGPEHVHRLTSVPREEGDSSTWGTLALWT